MNPRHKELTDAVHQVALRYTRVQRTLAKVRSSSSSISRGGTALAKEAHFEARRLARKAACGLLRNSLSPTGSVGGDTEDKYSTQVLRSELSSTSGEQYSTVTHMHGKGVVRIDPEDELLVVT